MVRGVSLPEAFPPPPNLLPYKKALRSVQPNSTHIHLLPLSLTEILNSTEQNSP